jgi:uncharacterized protein
MHAVDAQEAQDPVILVDADAAEWERNYAQWIHLAALIGGIVAAFSAGIGLPFVLVAVLTLWLVKKDQSPFVDDHGREALNFQISLLIYTIVLWPIAIVMTCGAGIILGIPIAILALAGTFRGSQAAQRGEFYRYPACLRFLR